MHERSLAKTILEQAQELGRRHGGAVRAVRLLVGALSGVEPALLQLALQEITSETDIAFECREVPLTLRCRTCSRPSSRPEVRFQCPHCGSREVDVTGGEAVILESIDVAAAEAALDPA